MFWVKHARFSAVFTQKLLVAVFIVTISNQIRAVTAPTGVWNFIDDHAPIISGIMQLNPLPKIERPARLGGWKTWDRFWSDLLEFRKKSQ